MDYEHKYVCVFQTVFIIVDLVNRVKLEQCNININMEEIDLFLSEFTFLEKDDLSINSQVSTMTKTYKTQCKAEPHKKQQT